MRATPRTLAISLPVTLVMLTGAAIFVYPVFLTVTTSLRSQDAVLNAPLALPSAITFAAYVTSWNVLAFGRLLVNSLIYASCGAGLALLLAIYPAFAFSRFRFLGARTIFILLLTTQMLPQEAALIPLYDTLTRVGLLNTRLGLILIHAAWGMPLQMLLLVGFFDEPTAGAGRCRPDRRCNCKADSEACRFASRASCYGRRLHAEFRWNLEGVHFCRNLP